MIRALNLLPKHVIRRLVASSLKLILSLIITDGGAEFYQSLAPFFQGIFTYIHVAFIHLSWIMRVTDPQICPAFFVSVYINPCLYMQMANLADADVPEEDKIKVVLNQSIYESMK